MSQSKQLLLISGSLRAGSTNTAVLQTARRLASPTFKAVLYEGMADLPHFNPDLDQEPLPEVVASLRTQLGGADAVLFSTPEYAGTLPGSFKNLLDWTVGGGEMYEMPVGWINVSGPASPAPCAGAYASLGKVLSYLGGAAHRGSVCACSSAA
jgi:chromate reductase, NAD(P)H dehydrogenase (quinone)